MKYLFSFLLLFFLLNFTKAQTNIINGYWTVLAVNKDSLATKVGLLNGFKHFKCGSTLCFDTSNNLYTNGNIVNQNFDKSVVKWDGNSWTKVGNGLSSIFPNYSYPPLDIYQSISSIVADKQGNIYASGPTFDSGYFKIEYEIKKWDGATWSKIGHQKKLYNDIQDLKVDQSGNLFSIGNFYDSTSSLLSISSSISKWNGSIWSEYGNYDSVGGGPILAIELNHFDSIVAIGYLYDSISNVAKYWTGTTWKKVGFGNNPMKWIGNPSNCNLSNIEISKDNSIYVSGINFIDSIGKYYVTKWNGTNWSRMGILPPTLNSNFQDFDDLETDSSGKLFASGYLFDSTNNTVVAVWNDTIWQTLATNNNPIFNSLNYSEIENIKFDNNGVLYAVGHFSKDSIVYGYVAKFTESNCQLQNDSIVAIGKIEFNLGDSVILKSKLTNFGYHYQWRLNGIDIPNSKDTIFTAKQSGDYSILITDSLGCFGFSNSIKIEVRPPINSYVSKTLCYTDSIFFNHHFLKTSGIYVDSLKNYLGIDSIVHLNLFFLTNPITNFYSTICSSDSVFFNHSFIKLTGIYYDTLPNFLGCDSIVMLHLISNSIIVNFNTTICFGDSIFFNQRYIFTSGKYTDSLKNYKGCDSIESLHLNVIKTQAIVVQNQDTLIANTLGIYQWIDCNNNVLISTNKIFIPSYSGSFSLIVSNNGCTDTSTCVSVLKTGQNISTFNFTSLSIFPNPAKQSIVISSQSSESNREVNSIEITDVLGRVCITSSPLERAGVQSIDVSTLPSGIYIIKATDLYGVSVYRKIVKE
jgi:hypothetical protein